MPENTHPENTQPENTQPENTNATSPTATKPLPPLLVVPWDDPVADPLGFDPRAEYVERFWLPLLGPTSTWLLRRLAAEFDDQPDGFSLDAAEVARSIGIGTKGGRSGPFHRSIDRCVRFGLAHHGDHGILGVRRRLPALGRSQLQRLPRHLQHRHVEAQQGAAQRSRPADDAHAARLARSLLDVGASPAEVEDQLRRWRFDDTAARRALHRARAEPDTHPSAS